MRKLQIFRESIEKYMKNEMSRPFTCSGSPLECRIFIVGLNSATHLGKPFFKTYWSDKKGFLRDRFDKDYYEIRGKRGVRPRIERFVKGASPIPCLETNLYSVPTRKAPELRKVDKDSIIFETLFDQIKPDALFVHSNQPIQYFSKFSGGKGICKSSPTGIKFRDHSVFILGLKGPLFRKKYLTVEKLGRIMKQCLQT